MQLLRENPTIAQVNAELQPAGAPGEAQLKMEVKDAQPFRFSIDVDNYRPPSVGSAIAQAHLDDLNLTGNNDTLSLTYGIATSNQDSYEFSGFDNVAAAYRFPISPWHHHAGTRRGQERLRHHRGTVQRSQHRQQAHRVPHYASPARVPDAPAFVRALRRVRQSPQRDLRFSGEQFSLSPGAHQRRGGSKRARASSRNSSTAVRTTSSPSARNSAMELARFTPRSTRARPTATSSTGSARRSTSAASTTATI